MAIATYVVTGARVVRTTTIFLAVALLVLIAAIQAFMSQYGDPNVATMVDLRVSDDRVSVVVAEQEATGLRCSAEPTLTDVVIVQDVATDVVTVTDLDGAFAASAAGTAWVRRYCV